ncbi:MAG: putative glutathione S-transferase-related transrane protein [Betaproteobacteria bacterium]|nr:putative glutathione S-transferase-related transrane protein [Betaproteobacteria bacterium]
MTQIDPKLDLVLERVIDVAPELVWGAWTQPEHIKKWFTPVPWQTVECEIDLKPGGIFRTVMRGPDGEQMPNAGCYLEIVPNRKLVWTSALSPGFRPQASETPVPFVFTAIIAMVPEGKGTRYTATVMHGSAESAKQHAEMGFYEGWGKALDQLVEAAKKF